MSAGHSLNPGWIPGNHWVVCDRCGHEYRHSDMKKEWNGLVVCVTCWEPRHTQDFVRGRQDRIAAAGLVRARPENQFVPCAVPDNPYKKTGVAGCAVAGCAICGVDALGIPKEQIDRDNDVPTGTF